MDALNLEIKLQLMGLVVGETKCTCTLHLVRFAMDRIDFLQRTIPNGFASVVPNLASCLPTNSQLHFCSGSLVICAVGWPV